MSLNTNGWDLVAAGRVSTVNAGLEALYQDGVIPHAISAKVQVPLAGTVDVQATYASPQVAVDLEVPNLVHVSFPITGGTITSTSQTIVIPSSGLTLTVTTDLKFVELQVTDDHKVLRLAIDFLSEDAVYDVEISGDPPGWQKSYNSILSAALLSVMQAAAAQTDYKHPFHIGDVHLPDDLPSGLEPSGQVDFTTQVVDHENADANIIAALIATAGDGGGSSNDFSNNPPLIPTGQEASLLVANQVLLRKLVGPMMAKSMGISESSLQYSGGGASAVTISLDGTPYLGGKYKMYLYDLSVSVGGSGAIDISYEVHAHPLVNTKETFYIKVTGSASITPDLETDDSGAQQIVFKGSHSKPSGKIEAKWYVYPIVAAAIVASFGSLLIFYGVIAAATALLLMKFLSFSVSMPSAIRTELEKGVASFKWPLQKEFPLTAIALPGDLVISGQPST